MKNIYTPADIDAIMEATIGNLEHISELPAAEQRQWMRRRAEFVDMVGEQAANEVMAMRGDSDAPVLVFAGDDICGAYALATATALHAAGCMAHVCLFNIGGNMLTPDNRAARDRFLEIAMPEYLEEVVNPGVHYHMPDMDKGTIVVDGLFGSSYKKPLRGGYQALARYINEIGPRVIAIDIPSGMTLDLSVGMINRNIIHADLTLAIVGPTLAIFMPENAQLIGTWKTLRLPLDKSTAPKCKYRLVDAKAIKSVMPPRDPYADKHDLGSALIYAGSYGMLGAAVMCTKAAARSGCGRVTCHGPRCGFYVMQTSEPTAMFETDGADLDIQRFESHVEPDAVAIGPGIGHSDATVYGLERFIKAAQSTSTPIILDADALNCIAIKPSMLDFIPARSVITPHAGEFDRLFGGHNCQSVRLLKAVEMAARHKIIIVLKSHYTMTVWPDGEILVNSSGTDALATAGSGDVLTGLMCGLAAQKMLPELAAVAAVYIHGIAGKIAASQHGNRSTTAIDIAEAIGQAIESIVNPRK